MCLTCRSLPLLLLPSEQVTVPIHEGGGVAGDDVGSRGWRNGVDMAVSPDRDVDERLHRRSRARGYK